MANTMTPSERITDGQIDKAVSVYREMLQKHRDELGSKEAQQVLGQADYVGELVQVLRRRVEAVSDVIVRTVKVNRSRTPQEVLNATCRKQYTTSDVVRDMPHGEKGETAEVIFFREGRFISDDGLEEKYELRGLKPADPYSQAAVNEADPTFADKNPNATHWKDKDGKWCYAAFHRWDGGESDVSVDRDASGWSDCWWFAGVRK